MTETSAKTLFEGPEYTGDEAIAKVREYLPAFRTAMLVTHGSGNGDLHVRPMGLQGDLSTFGGALWFFTSDESHKVDELRADPRCSVICQSDDASRYLHLSGHATLVDDRAKMRELYSPILKTWFPKGLEDPRLSLLRFDADRGSFWDSPGGAIYLLAAFTKSIVTGVPGKGGKMGTLEL